MARAFEVRLIGADKLIADINKYSETIQNEIAAELEDTARKVQMLAVEDAQAKIAPLAHESVNAEGKPNTKYDVLGFSSQIGFTKENKFNYEVSASHPMSAYFEFGTGATVFEGETWVDEELRSYARIFYVNGRGTITPHPFLFNNFYDQRIKLIETLKKITGA